MPVESQSAALRAAFVLSALGCVASAPAFAQSAAPPSPSAAPAPLDAPAGADARFAEFRASLTRPDTAAWVVYAAERHTVLIRPPHARVGSFAIALLRAGLAACAPALDLRDASIDSLVAARPFAAFDAATQDHPLVEITVTPRSGRPIGCGRPPEGDQASLALIAEGIYATNEPTAPLTNSVDAAELSVGGTIQPVAASGLVAATRLGPSGFVGRDGLSVVRLYVSVDALVRRTGGDAPVRLRVWSAARSEPTEIVLPSSLVAQVIRSTVPWRVARMREGALPELPVSLPTPRDASLAGAHEAYLRGDFVAATRDAARRLEAPAPREDVVSASLQVGFTFAAAGDDAVARWFVHRAMTLEPCLELPASAPARFRDLTNTMRPQARCGAVGVGRIVLGAWYPGRAQRVAFPEVATAGLVPALTAGLIGAYSIALHKDADRLYAQYRREIVNPQAKYFDARAAHIRANQVGAVFYAVWAADILWSVWRDRRQEAAVDAVRNYGARGAAPARIEPASGGFGLSVVFF